MALIPKQDLLHETIEGGLVKQKFRTYIGMSSLGGPCSRKIWYDFHWSYDRMITKRIERLFERGDLEEARVVKDLKSVGVGVERALEHQMELVDDTGHIKGHPDGIATNVPGAEKTTHLLEIKTMNKKFFMLYKNKGLKLSNPGYWAQVHTYMGLLKLTRCLFCVTNKDNEERHYERVKFDEQTYKECMSRGFDILTSEFIPKKIGEVTWFECKFCSAKDICHKGAKINRNCRTCQHHNIENYGEWSCDLHLITLDKEEQMLGCPDYQLSEVFLK